MSIEISEGNLITDIEVLYPLIKKSYFETEDTRIKLKLHWDWYLEKQAANELITILAKDGDTVIGFTVFAVAPFIHHADSLHATSEIFYVEPAYRASSIWKRLLEAVEVKAAEMKVERIFIGSRKRTRFFERFGYREDEITYSKVLI